MRRSHALCAVLLSFSAVAATAAMPKGDRATAEGLLKTTLYFRIDAPCGLGRHPFGTYKFPIVDVSPTEVTTKKESGISGGPFHAHGIYWGVGPNDAATFDSLKFYDDESAIEIEMKGVGKSDGNDTVIRFVNVNTLDDFKKAMALAFAPVPLQDEHADWSADVKKAVADRKLMDGLTKRQVFDITGSPESTTTSGDGAQQVEIWTMRQDKGARIGFWSVQAGEKTGQPQTLRFVGGKLSGVGAGNNDLKLDQ